MSKTPFFVVTKGAHHPSRFRLPGLRGRNTICHGGGGNRRSEPSPPLDRMAVAFSLCFTVATATTPAPPQNPRVTPSSRSTTRVASLLAPSTKRKLLLNVTSVISYVSLTQALALSKSSALESSADVPGSNPAAAATPTSNKLVFPGILNTKSWFQYFGNGFSIRVPPLFEDVMEPEDYNAGLSLYGDKVKPKKFAARFASPDGSEVVSVVIRPTNQLKITFLEAKDVTDLGSLKTAAKIFVPGGANLYSARTIKIKEDDNIRTYYYYEFGIDDQRVAFMAAVNSGKAFIAGAAAPHSRWDEDGAKLRSAAISLSL